MTKMKSHEAKKTKQGCELSTAGLGQAEGSHISANNPPASSYAKRRAMRLARGKRYGLRTEFHRDCQLIRSTLSPWLLSWKEASGHAPDESHIDADGRIWSAQSWGGDTDVQLVIAAHGPNLNELQWLIGAIVDCHVAAETIAPLTCYTGERIGYEELALVAVAPRAAMLKRAIKTLAQEQDTYALFSEFHQETIDKCRAALDGRARPQRFLTVEPEMLSTDTIWTSPDTSGLTPQAARALSKFLTVPRQA
ncbi:hypothetical protein HHL11_19325 [Ramlibacter sp. G-1-2-2]|uniref:Uncharacterized protein n=1 Tax=Ramlibacter agri TaxID=2728837 RepID=A0A848H8S7_9BURK|nr:hypothetical protein [Ramlibacter agri]NML45909.1 hypothetical protein [Ramlibacter agri]